MAVMKIKFNAAQRKVIQTIDGPVIAIAIPGSGKTSVVNERTWNMIQNGIAPDSILVMTFTKAAAETMKKRFVELHGNYPVRFGTIHSVCLSILKKFWPEPVQILKAKDSDFFFRSQFPFADDQKSLIQAAMNEISYVKNNRIDLEYYSSYVCENSHEFKLLLANYENFKREHHCLDFDDILLETYELLQINPYARDYWVQQYKYIMVDEFQDINPIQAGIIYLMVGKNRNICVVGDDDQSIYKFRGASPEIMLRFMKQFPDAKKINIGINYRSDPEILEQASNLISHNSCRYEKKLKAHRKGNGTIHLHACQNDSEIYESAAQIVSNLYVKHKVSLSDIAVLYRTNSENQPAALALSELEIPYHISGSMRLFTDSFLYSDVCLIKRLVEGQAAAGDWYQFMRISIPYFSRKYFPTDFTDSMDLFRKIRQRIEDSGGKIRRKEQLLKNLTNSFQTFSDLGHTRDAKEFIDMFNIRIYDGYLERYCRRHRSEANQVESYRQQMEAYLFYGVSLQEWCEKMETIDNRIQELRHTEPDSSCVSLSTLHNAKGLEWRFVIILNVTKDHIPYVKDNECDLEEERRLFYVGVTRAKENVILLGEDGNISPFYEELKKPCLEEQKIMPKQKIQAIDLHTG